LATDRKFPDLVTLEMLACIRLAIGIIALSLTLHLLMGAGWALYPNYKPQSKLRHVQLRLEGFGTMIPFTSWAWLILGVGFLFRGTLTAAAIFAAADGVDSGNDDNDNGNNLTRWAKALLNNNWFLRTSLVLWELTGPFAILTSSVITYVIWPQALRGGKPHNLAGMRNQLQHNCNSIFSLVEVSLLGGIPVVFNHLSLATAVGIMFFLFTWTMAVSYHYTPAHGPQYVYWFMDTTLDRTTTVALAALAGALTLFFGLFSFMITISGDDLYANVALVIVVTWLVCKFRD